MRAYAAQNKLRLHTPGHKGELCNVDLTELSDGSFPSEYLGEAQAKIAEYYGAKHCTILCCGSSQGVKSAIYCADANGIVDANSHRSVFDGFRLSGKKCVTVGKSDVMPITVKDIRNALTPDIGAVVVTSPTYYGYCADINTIADLCKRRGLIFIVDGAHGAHFGANKHLPKSFARDCDICNLSAHKTLNALTQSALLLDNLDGERQRRLSEAVDIMGTTSPSYLLYASVEYAVNELIKADEAYERLYAPIEDIKRRYGFLDNDDFTRLVLDCAACGADSIKLNRALVDQGVMSELVDDRYIVFIFTAADKPESVQLLDRALSAALKEAL